MPRRVTRSLDGAANTWGEGRLPTEPASCFPWARREWFSTWASLRIDLLGATCQAVTRVTVTSKVGDGWCHLLPRLASPWVGPVCPAHSVGREQPCLHSTRGKARRVRSLTHGCTPSTYRGEFQSKLIWPQLCSATLKPGRPQTNHDCLLEVYCSILFSSLSLWEWIFRLFSFHKGESCTHMRWIGLIQMPLECSWSEFRLKCSVEADWL